MAVASVTALSLRSRTLGFDEVAAFWSSCGDQALWFFFSCFYCILLTSTSHCFFPASASVCLIFLPWLLFSMDSVDQYHVFCVCVWGGAALGKLWSELRLHCCSGDRVQGRREETRLWCFCISHLNQSPAHRCGWWANGRNQ